jgi:hypothetical protein
LFDGRNKIRGHPRKGSGRNWRRRRLGSWDRLGDGGAGRAGGTLGSGARPVGAAGGHGSAGDTLGNGARSAGAVGEDGLVAILST